MDAALAEVPVQVAGVVVGIEQLAQGAQVAAQLLGGDRRVLPAFPGEGLAGHEGGCPKPRLPHPPDDRLLDGIVVKLEGGGLGEAREALHEGLGLGVGFRLGLAAELGQQPPPAVRQQLQVLGVQPLHLHVVDEAVVHPFEADGPGVEDLEDVVARLVHAGVADNQEAPRRRARHQAQLGREDRDAGALGPDQRAGHVEAVLRQQLVEAVPADPARDLGEALADERGVAIAQRDQFAVDLGPGAAFGEDPGEVLLAGLADRQAQPVVGQDVEGLDVLGGPPGHDRVDAARVVADHPAEGAVGVGGRVGPEGEPVTLGGIPQVVQDDPGLHVRAPGGGVQREQAVHVLREVDHDRHVAALAREAGAAAAPDHGHAEAPAEREGLHHVLDVAGDDEPDGHLAIVRRVGGIERTAAVVEAHLAFDLLAEGIREGLGLLGALAEEGDPGLGCAAHGTLAHGDLLRRWRSDPRRRA
ncbi:hypothetical protein D3C86_1203230 [compost metagenome]